MARAAALGAIPVGIAFGLGDALTGRVAVAGASVGAAPLGAAS